VSGTVNDNDSFPQFVELPPMRWHFHAFWHSDGRPFGTTEASGTAEACKESWEALHLPPTSAITMHNW